MCPPTNRQGSVAEPEVWFRIVHYYGSYSNAHRRKSLRRQALTLPNPEETPPKPEPEPAWLNASRKSWARMIRRVYEADLLLCQCGEPELFNGLHPALILGVCAGLRFP